MKHFDKLKFVGQVDMESLQTFYRKLEYNDWANRRAMDSLRTMEAPSSRAVRALSHVLLVEKLWLARLRRQEWTPPSEFFPELPLNECEGLIAESRTNYTAFLDEMTEEKLEVVGTYHTLAGSEYIASTGDVLTHVLMHSMYHRGQVALATREDGGEPLQSDYILFLRETSKAKSAES